MARRVLMAEVSEGSVCAFLAMPYFKPHHVHFKCENAHSGVDFFKSTEFDTIISHQHIQIKIMIYLQCIPQGTIMKHGFESPS